MVLRNLYACIALLSLVAAGCSSNGDGGGEFERPPGAEDVISDEELALLEEAGAVIHPGRDAPDVSGVYDRTDGIVIFHDRQEIEGTDVCFDHWTVAATADPEVYELSAESYHNCSGSSAGIASYISGSGNCFSLYSQGVGEREGCEMIGGGVTSGCLVDGGIENLLAAGIAGARIDLTPGACDALIQDGLISDEGERDILDFGFVPRIGD